MKRHFIFTVLVFLLICAPSNALYHQQEIIEIKKGIFFLTGNSLLSMLKARDYVIEMSDLRIEEIADLDVQTYSNNIMDAHRAMGYVMGIWDTFTGVFWQGSEHIDLGQLADVARKYLEDNPEKRAEAASYIVIEAFKKAFPIKKEGGS
jgi:hypothetical protein